MWTRTRKAFTLLELIVVIVILGILAALAIPTFNAVIDRAKDSNVKSAAASFDRNVRALAVFDQAAPNRGADVITAAGELSHVSMLATAGDGSGGANPDGNTVGGTSDTINVTVTHVQFTQDNATVCLTLGTSPGAPGTVVGGGCTGFAHDSFDRANSTTSLGTAMSGQAWQVANGSVYGISGNRGYMVSGQGEAWIVGPQPATSAEVDIIYTSSLTEALIFRLVDSGNYLHVIITDDKFYLYKKQGGVYGAPRAVVARTHTPGVTYHIRAELVGAVFRGYENGVLILTYTLTTAEQATFLAPNATGIGMRSSATSTRYDNLTSH